MAKYMIDPNGKKRKIHIGSDPFCCYAWVRVGLFSKIHQYAAGPHVVDNLVRRLESEGWKVVE